MVGGRSGVSRGEGRALRAGAHAARPLRPSWALLVSQAAVSLGKASRPPAVLPTLPPSPVLPLQPPHPALWLWPQAEGNYVRMLDMNSLKRLEYCSGFTVEISAPAPCFTVLAACAAFFLASYGVRMSMMAMK